MAVDGNGWARCETSHRSAAEVSIAFPCHVDLPPMPAPSSL